MFDLTREEVIKTLENYEKIMDRVADVVGEIGFTNEEFDALDSEKTDFGKDKVYVTAYDSHYDLYDSRSGSFPLDFLFENEEQHKDWYKNKEVEKEKERDSNILDYIEAFRFNYKNSGVDEDTVAISICNGKKNYLSSILNGQAPNFEKHSKGHFIFDAPTYTMYKIINGTVNKLFSTEDVNSCKAMNYIETLYAVLRR